MSLHKLKSSNVMNERYKPKRKNFIFRPKMTIFLVSNCILFFWETKEYHIGGRFKKTLLRAR